MSDNPVFLDFADGGRSRYSGQAALPKDIKRWGVGHIKCCL